MTKHAPGADSAGGICIRGTNGAVRGNDFFDELVPYRYLRHRSRTAIIS